MSWGHWKPYVPVAQRRAKAEAVAAKANKTGKAMQPVRIEGRTIARTFWGKAWCDNLEAYSDFDNRLPRGRSYVRNGSVVDLKIEPGKVSARVAGSRLYRVEIGIAAVPAAHWKSLAKECTGSIASLVELLQGRFSKPVMERLCQPKMGLFPAPKDIQLACSCPDWATMCKHVAAVLYGVGARLDAQPELLFTLRQVDAGELVTQAAESPLQSKKVPHKARVLDAAELSDVFGIEMAATDVPVATKQKPTARRPKPAAQAMIKPTAPARKLAPAKKAAVKKRVATKTPAKAATKSATMAKPPAATSAGKKAAKLPAHTPKPPAKRKSAEPTTARKTTRKAASSTSAQRKMTSKFV